ncbi:MAG: hypothetical protein HKP16_04285 [Xanthomonadales bacterium]|nr:hypothetical protein [Xanthomonadales bacterium]
MIRADGMALLTGLVLLAAVSVLALAAANGSLLQRRQAANFAEERLAAENAAIAEAQARAWLVSRADVERQAGCVSDCLLPPAIHGTGTLPAEPEFESAAWWRDHGIRAGAHPESGAPIGETGTGGEPARWLIEEIHFEAVEPAAEPPAFAGLGWYRILSRGSGRHPARIAVSEAIVARPWEGDYTPADYPPPAGAADFCAQFAPAVTCGTQAWRRRR